ncbi:MAG: phenylalanine--tRNA ligase subunit alpha [Planctomycetes bacterium]|nr:phenylalanine--tRNA ligase subunit alpha [Planctomycetota bacterium]NUQ35147.1 phenylalanine--tRNA ligase subunit alpha [Planctomycetaceae bacterium]
MAYDLDQLAKEARAAFAAAADAAAVEELRIRYLGSKGMLKDVMAAIKDVSADQKREYGQRANQLKEAVTQAHEEAKARTASAVAKGPSLDITKPGVAHMPGREHPVMATIREISAILERAGFKPEEGPEVEDPFHNFDALNIPPGHPARGEEDNFFLQQSGPDGTMRPVDRLLRSQTSTIQIRALEKYGVPVRISACGRCYRPDSVDATHHYMFHQIEILAVDKGLTLRDLRGVIEYFVKEYFGPETKFRFRPHYFPFTEISAEIDISSKQFKKEWLELGGCGVVDPNVLKAVGVDPEVYTGFAWGLGIERMFMLRHGVDDIRHFLDNDVRFLHQF